LLNQKFVRAAAKVLNAANRASAGAMKSIQSYQFWSLSAKNTTAVCARPVWKKLTDKANFSLC
jgi:hypothetical protein